jgi:hypothetical protein
MMTRDATPRQACRSPLVSRAAGAGVLFLLAACSHPAPHAAASLQVSDELRRARAFDQQGVLAFEAGRYHDALAYFDAAASHGGPPSERWNSAKCHIHLDEPEQAEADLVAYIGLIGLTAEDKREAEATLDALRRKPSMLTITSTPLGLAARVDGHHVGVTPVTVQVSPGEHLVVVERDASARDARHVTAHLGHAVLVEARP